MMVKHDITQYVAGVKGPPLVFPVFAGNIEENCFCLWEGTNNVLLHELKKAKREKGLQRPHFAS